MAELKLTYFDFPGGRGEDCRLTFHVAGVAFDDDRIKGPDWPKLKPETPFGGLPVLEVEGLGRLAQSNAILGYLGRRFDLHPADPWLAAQHEALMEAAEEARMQVGATLRSDPDEKKRRREELASGYLADWGQRMDRILGPGPFVSGDRLHVADLKLFVLLKWFKSGALDHIPIDLFDRHPRLMGVYEAVRTHPAVQAWYARFGA